MARSSVPQLSPSACLPACVCLSTRNTCVKCVCSCCAPDPTGKGGPAQLDQVKLWKGFLEYERSNPQRLDATALTQRVELAYMQALMCLMHFPEVRETGREGGQGREDGGPCSRALQPLMNKH